MTVPALVECMDQMTRFVFVLYIVVEHCCCPDLVQFEGLGFGFMILYYDLLMSDFMLKH